MALRSTGPSGGGAVIAHSGWYMNINEIQPVRSGPRAGGGPARRPRPLAGPPRSATRRLRRQRRRCEPSAALDTRAGVPERGKRLCGAIEAMSPALGGRAAQAAAAAVGSANAGPSRGRLQSKSWRFSNGSIKL